MKKPILRFTVFLLVLALLLSACGKKQTEPKSKAEAICRKALAVSDYGPMFQIPVNEYSERLQNDSFDLEQIVDSAWYGCEKPSSNADEIRIFCMKDAASAKALAQIFEAQLAKKLRVFRELTISAQVKKLEQAEVVTQDNWVYLCVGENSAEMMDVIASELRH